MVTHRTLGSEAHHGLLVDVVGCNAALHAAADGGDGWQRSVLLGAAVVQPTALCQKEWRLERSYSEDDWKLKDPYYSSQICTGLLGLAGWCSYILSFLWHIELTQLAGIRICGKTPSWLFTSLPRWLPSMRCSVSMWSHDDGWKRWSYGRSFIERSRGFQIHLGCWLIYEMRCFKENNWRKKRNGIIWSVKLCPVAGASWFGLLQLRHDGSSFNPALASKSWTSWWHERMWGTRWKCCVCFFFCRRWVPFRSHFETNNLHLDLGSFLVDVFANESCGKRFEYVSRNKTFEVSPLMVYFWRPSAWPGDS